MAAPRKPVVNPLAEAIRANRGAFVGVGVASALLNLLTLSGSLYMLQVYDRVLPARSPATLVVLTIALVFSYSAYWFFDLIRMRILSRVGARLDRTLRADAFRIHILLALKGAGTRVPSPLQELDQIRGFLSGLGPVAILDLPWMPFFLFIIFLMHPYLGYLALAGMLVIVAMTVWADFASREPMKKTSAIGAQRSAFAESCRRNAEVLTVLGMRGRLADIWSRYGQDYFKAQDSASSASSSVSGAAKVLRMFLQSAMLGLGAWLVINQQASGGVMIASSIIFSRALAPVEIALANWKGFINVRQSYARLSDIMGRAASGPDPMALPAPRDHLAVGNVFVGAPGTTQPIVSDVSFRLVAGDGLGVIGPSGSGKTTLIRALTGAWSPLRGEIRLDGASLDQWNPDDLGRHIGYLPQDIELFEGTVAQNIARFDPDADPERVIAAAKSAGVHDMILKLPAGYDTAIGEQGGLLSGGQRQRVALARALYGDPFLVVLDEPNSNLDNDGDIALSGAIRSVRERGGIVIVIAHRPSALAGLDKLMVMQAGRMAAFGPRDAVMRQALQNAPAVVDKPPPERRETTPPVVQVVPQ